MNKPDEEFSYDPIADAYARTIDVAPYNALYERPAMLALMPRVEGMRILEAGCGSGVYTELLLRRGAHVTGIDASAAMLEHARQRIVGLPREQRQRVTLRVADLREPLSFAADASYGGVVSALVMHYLRDWSTALGEFRRVLRAGGWLLFSTHHPFAAIQRTPEGESYFDVAQEEDDWKRIGRVLFYRRSLTAISGALADAGFAIERLVEPQPTEAFRAAMPDSAERLLRIPEFLLVLARLRPW